MASSTNRVTSRKRNLPYVGEGKDFSVDKTENRMKSIQQKPEKKFQTQQPPRKMQTMRQNEQKMIHHNEIHKTVDSSKQRTPNNTKTILKKSFKKAVKYR